MADRVAKMLEQANCIFDDEGGAEVGTVFDPPKLLELQREVAAGSPATASDFELAMHAAEHLGGKLLEDVDRFDTLATHVLIDYIDGVTPATLVGSVDTGRAQTNPHKPGQPPNPLVSERYCAWVHEHAVRLEPIVVRMNRVLRNKMTYLGVGTLMKNYLLRSLTGGLTENIAQMYARIGLGINIGHLDDGIAHFKLLARGVLSQASPQMYYAGTPTENYKSCFLLTMPGDEDSIKSIADQFGRLMIISKGAGGCGQAISTVRAAGTIVGQAGRSDGLVPMLACVNSIAKYVDQGKVKRPAAIASYLEPWHADVVDFVQTRAESGDAEMRTHQLHIAVWLNDLFLERVDKGGMWSLMCPYQCPGLYDVYGDEFKVLYEGFEREGRFVRQLPAQELFDIIAEQIRETGEPYMLSKDNVNRCSMQKNLGTIRCSNLCFDGDTEIMTDRGPVLIGSCVPGSRQDRTKLAKRSAFAEKLAELELLKVQTEEESAQEQQCRDVLATMPEIEALAEPTPINVWNGTAFVTVTPQRTGVEKEMMVVVTSHGSRITCTPDHEFILKDGSRTPANKLAIGSELAYAEPVKYDYTPLDSEGKEIRLGMDSAFTMGFLYGYALKKDGVDMVDGTTRTYKAALLMKSMLDPAKKKEIKMLLHYNEDKVRAEPAFDQVDHDNLWVIEFPEGMQAPTAPRLACLREREAWLGGFTFGIEHRLENTTAPYSMVAPVWKMMRSVGEHVKVVRNHANGLFRVEIIKDPATAAPKVVMLQGDGFRDDTYCFTEPGHNRVVAEEQAIGQCAEIVQFASPDEIACCTLGSIVLSEFVRDDRTFDFAGLHAAAKAATKYLNRVLDNSNYSLPEMSNSNFKHRPIAIGVQSWHKAIQLMRQPLVQRNLATGKWEPHPVTRTLNANMFECMLHGAHEATVELAAAHGRTYASYPGSPAAGGLFHFELFDPHPDGDVAKMYDWEPLRAELAKHGRYNSLLIALMPTATTSKILDSSEGIDPLLSNIFVHSGLGGDYFWVNKPMVRHLQELGLWTPAVINAIRKNEGSIQSIEAIPEEVRRIYMTAFELPQSPLITMSADRQRYVEQSESFNVHLEDASIKKIWAITKQGWQKGKKTLSYYTRTRPSTSPQKVTVDNDDDATAEIKVTPTPPTESLGAACSLEGGNCCSA